MASLNLSPPAARYHGDQAVAPGMLDFAVNVRHGQPPGWLLQRLAARLPDLARYPSIDDVHAAQDAAAQRHGRARGEVLPLAGAAEGFALLSNLRPALAAIIAPSFTEPAAALTAAGVPVHHVVLEPPFGLEGAVVPEDADLVVVGNPTNPTSVLHTPRALLALRRPGRIVVVDEAFADAIPGEPESLAGDVAARRAGAAQPDQDVGAGGLRVGYALGSPEVLARLTARRAHWPSGRCSSRPSRRAARRRRSPMRRAGAAGWSRCARRWWPGWTSAGARWSTAAAPFVLFRMPGADLMRKSLQSRGIAVRRCDTFVGLDERYLRAAVRPEWPLLVEAIAGGAAR